MIRCKYCGSENEDQGRFCFRCGKPMSSQDASQPVGLSEVPSAPRGEPSVQKLADSPLASQLPSWDLLPAHTLLVRRRPIKK